MDRVVVVGAGLAGLRACEGLRARGHEGEVVLLGDEPQLPYDRPPLSKQFLAGEWEEDRVVLRPRADLARLGVDMRLGAEFRAVHLDAGEQALTLASGDSLSYDGLVLATGARARTLPVFELLERAHLLRTIADARALKTELSAGRRLLVIGAGFIGMEVAATARGLGVDVVVVEPLETPLARVLGRLPGEACQDLHEAHGVRLLLGRGVESLSERSDGTVQAVLTDGSSVEADVLLAGVGAVPNVEWLDDSGLEVGPSGVQCDGTLLAGPGVVVAGDLALWPAGAGGTARVRLEHRTNAAEQGDHAAATLLGDSKAFDTVPYVWSDQYDVKIQVLGLPQPEDECRVVVRGAEEGRFVAMYGRGGLLTGAVGFHMPRQLMQIRPMLASPTPYEEATRRFA